MGGRGRHQALLALSLHDGLPIFADRFADRPSRAPGREIVVGPTRASLVLERALPRLAVASALDLGTGAGLLALRLAIGARRVVASDVSARALAFTALNAAINQRPTTSHWCDRTVRGLAAQAFLDWSWPATCHSSWRPDAGTPIGTRAGRWTGSPPRRSCRRGQTTWRKGASRCSSASGSTGRIARRSAAGPLVRGRRLRRPGLPPRRRKPADAYAARWSAGPRLKLHRGDPGKRASRRWMAHLHRAPHRRHQHRPVRAAPTPDRSAFPGHRPPSIHPRRHPTGTSICRPLCGDRTPRTVHQTVRAGLAATGP